MPFLFPFTSFCSFNAPWWVLACQWRPWLGQWHRGCRPYWCGRPMSKQAQELTVLVWLCRSQRGKRIRSLAGWRGRCEQGRQRVRCWLCWHGCPVSTEAKRTRSRLRWCDLSWQQRGKSNDEIDRPKKEAKLSKNWLSWCDCAGNEGCSLLFTVLVWPDCGTAKRGNHWLCWCGRAGKRRQGYREVCVGVACLWARRQSD